MPKTPDTADPKISKFLAAIEAAERDASAAEEELEEARSLTKERKEIYENHVMRLRRMIRDFSEPAPLLDAIEAMEETAAAAPTEDDAWRSASLGQLPIPTDAWAALSEAGLETMGDLDDVALAHVKLSEKLGITPPEAQVIWNAFEAKKAELTAPADAAADGDRAGDDDAWRETPLEVLGFPVSIHARVHEAGLLTLGQLADWTAGGKLLTDIPGIGPSKAAKIEDALERFWAERTPGAQPIPPASSEESEPFEAPAPTDAAAPPAPRPTRRTRKAQDAAPLLPT